MRFVATAIFSMGLAITGCPEECVDADGDGFAASEQYCYYRPYLEPGDCDDADAELNPLDRDGDRYSSCDGDCDDLDDEVHPEADDLACDAIDSDCDGADPEMFAVEHRLPEPGSDDVHPRPQISLELDGRVTHLQATAEIVGDDGTLVVLDGVTGGGRVTFPPVDPPLEPMTDYEVTVRVGCLPEQSWTFTTGVIGTAVDDDAIAGDFLLDLGTSNSHMPGHTGLVESMLSGSFLALNLEGADDEGGEVQAFSAVLLPDGYEYRQDLCIPTSTWGGEVPGPAEWTNPHLWADGFPLWSTIDYGSGDLLLQTEPTTAAATVTPDGDAVTQVWIETVVDTRPLWPLFGDVADEWEACTLLTSLGLECETCPDGEPACATTTLLLEDAPRISVEGTHPDTGEPLDTLIEVDEDDVQRWMDLGICPSN